MKRENPLQQKIRAYRRGQRYEDLKLNMQLLRVCRKIHAEAAHIPYAKHKFVRIVPNYGNFVHDLKAAWIPVFATGQRVMEMPWCDMAVHLAVNLTGYFCSAVLVAVEDLPSICKLMWIVQARNAYRPYAQLNILKWPSGGTWLNCLDKLISLFQFMWSFSCSHANDERMDRTIKMFAEKMISLWPPVHPIDRLRWSKLTKEDGDVAHRRGDLMLAAFHYCRAQNCCRMVPLPHISSPLWSTFIVVVSGIEMSLATVFYKMRQWHLALHGGQFILNFDIQHCPQQYQNEDRREFLGLVRKIIYLSNVRMRANAGRVRQLSC